MYNYFKHSSDRQQEEESQRQNMIMSRWHRKHQGIHVDLIEILRIFLMIDTTKKSRRSSEQQQSQEQDNNSEKFYFEDDHFDRWRPMKQFRDTKKQTSFIGFKSFVHRPNSDMKSLLEERQRREKKDMMQKSQFLIDSNIIPPEQVNRGIRCQGPLPKSVQYRQRDTSKKQPPMRFQSRTDQQRFVDNNMPQSKFMNDVYSKFQEKRSKIGNLVIDKLNNIGDSQCKSIDIQPSESLNFEQKEPEKPHVAKMMGYSTFLLENTSNTRRKINSVVNHLNKSLLSQMPKTHYKAAKELSQSNGFKVLHPADPQDIQRAKYLMRETQYDREKHLQNVTHNKHHQCFSKLPII